MNIKNNLTELIGHTPLLALHRWAKQQQLVAEIVAKVEYFNPGGSVKDRVALSMITDAEEKRLVKAWRPHHRTNQWKYRCRISLGCFGKRIQINSDYARNHEPGTP